MERQHSLTNPAKPARPPGTRQAIVAYALDWLRAVHNAWAAEALYQTLVARGVSRQKASAEVFRVLTAHDAALGHSLRIPASSR